VAAAKEKNSRITPDLRRLYLGRPIPDQVDLIPEPNDGSRTISDYTSKLCN